MIQIKARERRREEKIKTLLQYVNRKKVSCHIRIPEKIVEHFLLFFHWIPNEHPVDSQQ